MKRLILLLSLVLATASFAQKPAGFTLEQVMSSPFPTALTSAAKANRIAWVFDSKGERNVWIADAPDFAARQVTHYQGDDGQDIFAVKLTPDGKTLLYARGSEVSSEGHVANPSSELKEPRQQVWAVELENGKTRLVGDMGCNAEDCEDIQISPDGKWAVWVGAKHQLWIAGVNGDKPARQLMELRGDEEGAQWSPDGRHIAFTSDRKNHSFVAVLDLEDGVAQRVHYVAPSVDRDFAPRWSPDGKQLVFLRVGGAENHLPLISRRPRPWAIWLANLPGEADGGSTSAAIEVRELWHSGKSMDDSLPPFASKSLKFADSGKIVFCSEQDGRNHLYLIPAAGGQAMLLTRGNFDVEDVELTPDKTAVLYTSNQNEEDRRHIFKIPLGAMEIVNGKSIGVTVPVTRGETIEWHPLMLADGKTIVCLGSSATTPAMPYRVTDKSREMIAADALPKDFPSTQLVEPEAVTFRSEDGLEVHGQLFVPRNRTAAKLVPPAPALIFVHGGPQRQMLLGFHYMYYYHNSYAQNQYLASLGYVVLSVNYRLGIMYGRAFRDPANAGWRGASEYKDVVAGARYLQSLSYVDHKRIGIWGGSYGGFLTAMALARNSDIFSAGVDFHGVDDWSELVNGRFTEDAPDYKEALKLAFDSSPAASVATWKSPVLLIHGDDDRSVPFGQTVDLAQRLRQQHVQFEQLIFPDEIHDLLLWKSWVSGYNAGAEFFNKKLGAGSTR